MFGRRHRVELVRMFFCFRMCDLERDAVFFVKSRLSKVFRG